MGIYGVDFYGGVRFGQDPALIRPDFSVAPFAAVPVGYGAFSLTWVQPESTTCTQLRLVRNKYSLPQDETDGFVLFTNPNPGSAPAFQDLGVTPGFNYYSIFGYDSVNNIWIRSSDLVALLPINWGYAVRAYDLLPGMYRDRDYLIIDPTNPLPQDNSDNPPLQRFLQLLGFQLDYVRTFIESLMMLNDPMNISGVLLPLMAFQFGIPYEPELGMQRTRAMIDNAIHLYKLKGTTQGISEFVSTLTNWPVLAVLQGFNKALSVDDSIMAFSLGTWELSPPTSTYFGVDIPSGGGSAWHLNTVGTPDNPTGVTLTPIANLTVPPTNAPNPVTNLNFTPVGYNNSGMRISTTGIAGNAILTTGAIPLSAFLERGSVSTGEITIQFQFYTPVGTAARFVSVGVADDLGNFIGTVTNTATTPGAWKTVTWSTSNLTAVTGTNIYPYIRVVNMGANESHYLTLFGIWSVDASDIGDTTLNIPAFDYPRELKIYLEPQRSNLLGNPLTSFANGIDGWTANINPLSGVSGTSSAKLNIVYPPVDGDPAGIYKINGVGSLSVQSIGFPTTTVFGGSVAAVSSVAKTAGWFESTDWFGGAVNVFAAPRTWFADPGSPTPWWMMNQGWFMTGTTLQGGDWFPNPAPTQVDPPIPIVPQINLFYTFSVYVRAMENDANSTTAYPGIWWHFPDGSTLMSFGTAQTITSTGFTRVHASIQTPVHNGLNPDGFMGFLQFKGAPANAEWLLNSGMIEPAPSMGSYFDASQFSGTSDYFFDLHGASYYYKRRAPKAARLAYWLPYFIPQGLTYALIYAAGETTQAPFDPGTI